MQSTLTVQQVTGYIDKKTLYYPALTGLRAIAAGLVFLNHFNPFEKSSHPWLYIFVHKGISEFLSFLC